MTKHPQILSFIAAVTFVGPLPALTPQETTFFEKEIRPLLVEHCYKCHSTSADKLKGGLLLDSQAGWMNGGDSGEAIVPGNPDASLLLRAVAYDDPDLQMPPKYQLSAAQVAALRRWIQMGAPDPRSDSVEAANLSNVDLVSGRQFWAFRPLSAAIPPKVRDTSWPKSDLDRFILGRLEEKGLRPVPDADRSTLLRRISFDLVGLPPTLDQLEDFMNDPAQDDQALATVVDGLLSSPQFGERWGRHWLDVVRYAESVGRTRNWPYPFAWRYRDYVIGAFNQDKPYDQFIREQVAGDLLPALGETDRNEHLVATGFLALGAHDLNENNAVQFAMDVVDDQIDVTTRAFLGLTVACARCHDHKFDPIPTRDYYALAGIFRSTELRSGYTNRRGGKSYLKPELFLELAGPEAPAEAERLLPKKEAKARRLEERAEALNAELKEIKRAQKRANQSNAADAAQAKRRTAQIKRELKQLSKQVADLENDPALPPNAAMGVAETKPVNCRVAIRGDARNTGDLVPRGFLQVLSSESQPEIPAKSGGRLELAQCLTQHPLTARVMVNRIWHHLFGRGLVPTVDNFGETGERPSHPELLDHLAQRLRAHEGSVKKTIREIVLSRTYRMGSQYDPDAYQIDPDNQLLSHMNSRRLEAEALRDAILRVSGQLDLTPLDGSPVQEMRLAEIGRRSALPNPEKFTKRSVYLPVLRNNLLDIQETFDFAEPSSVIGRRDVTTVSTQALFMMNSEFVIEQARHLAVSLSSLAGDAVRVRKAYRRALARSPTAKEEADALAFVEQARVENLEQDVWSDFCQALFACAEFRYVQ